MNQETIDNFCADFYLDYFNDFLSRDGMAAYYAMPVEAVTALIERGRFVHESRCYDRALDEGSL